MRARMMATLLLSLGLLHGPAEAQQANLARAEQTCITTALQQLMVHRRTLSQSPMRDSRGRTTGMILGMEVRHLGRKTEVTCIFDAAKSVAVIERRRPPSTLPGVTPVPAAEVVRACTRAAQAQRLMVDTVASQSTIRNRQGQPIGRTVMMNVFQSGRPRQVQCDYDYASRNPALQIRRPQPR